MGFLTGSAKDRTWKEEDIAAADRKTKLEAEMGGADQSPAPPGGHVIKMNNPLMYGGGETDTIIGPNGDVQGLAGPSSAEKELNRYRGLGEAAAQRQAYQVDFGRAQADRANQLGARGNQMRAMEMQNEAQMGRAPSRAAIMGNQVAGQSLEAALGASAGARGLGAASAQMQAARGQGAMQLQGAQQATGMRAGEIDQARNQYAQGMTAIRGGDYANMSLSQQQAEAQAQSENAQRRLNQAGQMGYEQAGLNVQQAELDASMRLAVARNNENATARGVSDARTARAEKVGTAGVSAVGSLASDERSKRNVSSFSDAQAKKEAYALGRAHQWEQGKTGKPVEWAHEMPKDVVDKDERRAGEGMDSLEMSGDRGYRKPAGGKASTPVARATPPAEAPGWVDQQLQKVPTYQLGQQHAREAAAAQPMAPAAPSQGLASYAAQARTMLRSDERTKKNVDPMTDALADGLAPHSFEYKDGFAQAEGQQPGEKNVGIMAQNAERNPITGVIVEKGEDGMRRINMKKSTSLALAAAGHNAQKLRELEARMDKKGGR